MKQLYQVATGLWCYPTLLANATPDYICRGELVIVLGSDMFEPWSDAVELLELTAIRLLSPRLGICWIIDEQSSKLMDTQLIKMS